MRPNPDEYYLGIARAVSKRSTCLRRQYGAVIVNNNEIISTGYNGSPRGEVNCCDVGICNRTGHAHNDGDYRSCCSVHAEMNAIISASRSEMLGATLYLAGFEDGQEIVGEPCPVCQKLIKNAGIVKVVTNDNCNYKSKDCSPEDRFITDYNFENRATKAVYDEYVEYCLMNNYKPISHIMFSKYIVQYTDYKIINKTITGKKYRVFVRKSK